MIKLILNLLIRAIKVGAKLDQNIASDVYSLPNGYVIKINVKPNNTWVCIKLENGKLIKIEEDIVIPDLLVEFKDSKSATKCLLGKISLAQAFCEHRIKIYGNINNAMALTRVVNTIECYLFPKFIYEKLFSPTYELGANKGKFYLTLLFGGKL